jgi:hypothetical protein
LAQDNSLPVAKPHFTLVTQWLIESHDKLDVAWIHSILPGKVHELEDTHLPSVSLDAIS